MYVEETKASSDLSIPPPNGPIIWVWSENRIINDHQIVKIHHMTHKNMQFYQSILWMHIIQPDSIIKTSNYQLLAYYITLIDCNLVTSYFILVPKQYEFILIASH